MATMTFGQHLLASMLPPDVYRPGEPIDKKSAGRIFSELARRHPDKYRELSQRLLLLGSDVARSTGGASFGIEHLKTPPQAKARRERLQQKLDQILRELPENKQQAAIVEALGELQATDSKEVVNELSSSNNPLVEQLKGAGRGNPASLARLVASDLMYAGPDKKPIPIPIMRSYSQGLTPAEYVASTFGARSGLVDVKVSVQSSGYLAKLLLGAAHRMVVTGVDAEEALQSMVSERGLPVDVDDPDNVGAFLVKPVGPYGRDTPLTPKILAHLKKLGHDQILVRSPITSVEPNGGVYAKDVGIREQGALPQIGEAVGITAAGSLAEPLTQSMLSSKHAGGVAKAKIADLEGFALIERLVNPPKEFREAATHTSIDGTVTAIKPAPQGGSYVYVNDKEHYVPDGRTITAAVGSKVEAGDTLTDGTLNPREVVYHKGIGEGARQLVMSLRDGMRDSGLPVNRRNIELMVRGLVDRVRVSEEFDDYNPDDIVPYNEIAARWQPREGSKESTLESVAGKYLERPTLHYSIGTRITPSVVKQLRKFKIDRVLVNDRPAPFEPEMVRGIDLLRTDSDWMTRQMGTSLQKGFLQGIHLSASSDENSTSFIPSRARATDFGNIGPFKLKPPKTPQQYFEFD